MTTAIHQNRRRIPSRRGSILLMVLVAIIIMSLTTSSYLLLMRNEHLAARYHGNHIQTKQLVDSGVDYLRVFLAQTPDEIELQGGLLDNPDSFQDVLVIDDPIEEYRGRFAVVASGMTQGYYQGVRFGLENESAKLNLNSLVTADESQAEDDDETSARDRLLFIPGMTDEIADAILDWLDTDDSQRTYGAESAYYQSLTPAYTPRNGPLSNLDELLMVRGVTPQLLYGIDTNRNYAIDPDELPRGDLEQLDNTNGEIDRGWSAYFTVHSLEQNISPDGEPKLDLNAEDLQTLHGDLETALDQQAANFIIAYRQYGPLAGESGGEGNEANESSDFTPDFEVEAKVSIDSLLSLVDAKVQITSQDDEQNNSNGGGNSGGGRRGSRGGRRGNESQNNQGEADELLTSPWTDDPNTYREAFAQLLDVATIDAEERVAGRININQASLPVLLTIPEMTQSLADQIIASRDPVADPINGEQRHPTWLLAEGLITIDEAVPIMWTLTTGGDVFSGQVVGYFDAGTARARATIVLDRSGESTRLIDWRDLSPLGPGFSRSVVSATALGTESEIK